MLVRFERDGRRSDTPLAFFDLEPDRSDERLSVFSGGESSSVEISWYSPTGEGHAVED